MSSFLSYRSPEEAGEEWMALVESTERSTGYVPNYLKLWAHHPDAYEGWRSLISAVVQGMDQRRYELATVAAARRLRSSYCSLAHGKILAEKFHTADEVVGLYTGEDLGVLDEVDRAVMDFADKVASDATSVTRDDIEGLRALGLSDRDVFDVILAAAVRCFFAKVTDAAGTLPDAAYRELIPGLLHDLTVGRPVEKR